MRKRTTQGQTGERDETEKCSSRNCTDGDDYRTRRRREVWCAPFARGGERLLVVSTRVHRVHLFCDDAFMPRLVVSVVIKYCVIVLPYCNAINYIGAFLGSEHTCLSCTPFMMHGYPCNV